MSPKIYVISKGIATWKQLVSLQIPPPPPSLFGYTSGARPLPPATQPPACPISLKSLPGPLTKPDIFSSFPYSNTTNLSTSHWVVLTGSFSLSPSPLHSITHLPPWPNSLLCRYKHKCTTPCGLNMTRAAHYVS